jgi:hypothetical protein
MDWNLKLNYDKRRALFAQAKEMEKKRDEELDALPDDMEDEAYDNAVDEAFKRYNTLPIYEKIRALEYKESRNAWFRDFVKSFGICKDRRVTRKQAEVFARYSEPRHEWRSGRGMQYYVRVGNLFIETWIFSQNEPGYVTITELLED